MSGRSEGDVDYTPHGIAAAAIEECDRHEANGMHSVMISTTSLRELAEWALARRPELGGAIDTFERLIGSKNEASPRLYRMWVDEVKPLLAEPDAAAIEQT